jgi:hypothetical protein
VFFRVRLWLFNLTFDRVANVFDSFADFASRFTESFLDITADTIGCAFGFEIFIVERAAESFFHSAFGLIPFAFHFISVW